MSDRSSTCLHPGSLAAIVICSVLFGVLLTALVLYWKVRTYLNAAEARAKVDASSAEQHAHVTHNTQSAREYQSSSPLRATTGAAALQLPSPSAGIHVSNVSPSLDDPELIVSPSPLSHSHAIGGSYSPNNVSSASPNEPDPLRSRQLDLDELAQLQSLVPQHKTSSPNREPLPQSSTTLVQHMLEDLTRLRTQMDQFVTRPDAPGAPLSKADASSSSSLPPRRVKETASSSPLQPAHHRAASPPTSPRRQPTHHRTASTQQPAPMSPRAVAAAAPLHQHLRSLPPPEQSKGKGVVESKGKGGLASCAIPSPPSSPRLQLQEPHNDLQQQQRERPWGHQGATAALLSAPAAPAHRPLLPPPQETYPDSGHAPRTAAMTPSRIARVSSPPPVGSPSEVYVEISRLVAEAYHAVAPHLAQQGDSSDLTQRPAGQAGGHAPSTPPRKHAPSATVTPPSTKSPNASPKLMHATGGKRPTWRGGAL
jgi:hypothetical protein